MVYSVAREEDHSGTGWVLDWTNPRGCYILHVLSIVVEVLAICVTDMRKI